ncbi:translation initiation factor eIF3 subunit i Ecym_5599 [Eremothecium cymbalariae DBVPG|uniref:Eukaryotic translation initiation factor 3 subunit I n=1 Tax=Eremothecium cymbalariae (strain CBS 270.75 / DBVPG 7215 / KCTC 17166 / NRRL Y-17582) TaxID=931890 RepID=I6NE44_ERECY|nr:hypothetical protein Ecym_5599 [Eremothecium cymbalariae DBVPG\
MRPIMMMGHERSITQVKYNREGDLIFSCGKDAVASVWYSVNGERLGTLEDGHMGILWSIDVDDFTEYAVTGGGDAGVVIWRVKDGSKVHKWELRSPVLRVEFSPNGDKLLAVCADLMGHVGSICIIDIARDSANKIIGYDEEPTVEICTIEGTAPVQVASWSYDGKYIVAGHRDGNITKYDGRTGQLLQSQKLHKQLITDIQLSLDRTYFITTSRDCYANLVDVETFEVLKSYETDCPLNSGCITPLKDFIIVGGGQDAREVTTTSAREGKFEAKFFHKLFQTEIGRIDDHFGPINCIAVSPQGTSYVSGGEDGFIRLHHFDKNYFDFKFDVERSADAQKKVVVPSEIN